MGVIVNLSDTTWRDSKKAGIRKIRIPVRQDEVSLDVIKAWLPYVLPLQSANAAKIDYYEKFVSGSFQPIMNKTRPFETSGNANNRIIENHASELVNFKCGFLLGDKKQFTQKEDVHNDDLIYFNRYLDNVNFATKDLTEHYNLYSTGIAVTFVQPRTDILVSTGENSARYKSADEGYDVEKDAPFAFECVDAKYNAVVYSSFIGQNGLGDLFCFNINDTIDAKGISKSILTVYTREETYIFDDYSRYPDNVRIIPPTAYGELPMTEHSLNDERIGIIELTEDLLNAANTIVSSSVDNVVDAVNQLLVFSGTELNDGDVQKLYQEGAILLPPSATGEQPKVSTISIDFNHSDVNVLFEQVLTRLYDIAGVPLASASVSSGNNEAAYLGGGWTHAYTVIKKDILFFEAADRELLKKMLKVCALNPDNPVNEVRANDIDIKYNVNQSNNLVNKTQALQNLVDANLPFEDILKAVNIWGDVHTVAKRWQENIDRLNEEADKKTETVTSTIGAESNLALPD